MFNAPQSLGAEMKDLIQPENKEALKSLISGLPILSAAALILLSSPYRYRMYAHS